MVEIRSRSGKSSLEGGRRHKEPGKELCARAHHIVPDRSQVPEAGQELTDTARSRKRLLRPRFDAARNVYPASNQ